MIFDDCKDCVSTKAVSVVPLFHVHFTQENNENSIKELSQQVADIVNHEENITVVIFKRQIIKECDDDSFETYNNITDTTESQFDLFENSYVQNDNGDGEIIEEIDIKFQPDDYSDTKNENNYIENETEDQQEARRKKNRERKCAARENETEEQKESRRKRNRERTHALKENETEEQKEAKKIKNIKHWTTEELKHYKRSVKCKFCVLCGDDGKGSGVFNKRANRIKEHFRKCYIGKTNIALQLNLLDCRHCEASCATEEECSNHNKEVHNDLLPHKCGECSCCFETYLLLLGHIRKQHKAENAFHCQECPRKFSKFTYLAQHLTSVHNKIADLSSVTHQKIPCPDCGLMLSKTSIEKHQEIKHKGLSDKETCSVCGKSFNRRNIKAHMRRHSGEKPFKCITCKKGFTTFQELESHRINNHEEDANIKCEECGLFLKTQEKLNLHVKTKHLHQNKVYICSNCGKTFKDKYSHEHHYSVCTKTTDFVCTYEDCTNKYFGTKRDLERHVNRIHLKLKAPKNHTCELCGKAFANAKAVTLHVRLVHTGERPFQCKLCEKAFTNLVVLNRHQQIHDPIKRFKCQFCSKAFTQEATLFNHTKKCSDENKPLMVFVHGFPEFWYSWRFQIKHFQKDYHVVALDMRGYNDSDKPAGVENYSLPILVNDIKVLVESLGSGKFTLVSHDWGGLVAWAFAAKHPDMLLNLVTCNIPHPIALGDARKEGWEQVLKSWYVIFFQCPILPELNCMSEDMGFFNKIFAEADLHKDEDLLEAFKYAFRDFKTWNRTINYYRSLIQNNEKNKAEFGKLYKNIKVRTLVIFGTGDRYLSVKAAKYSAKYVEDLQLELLEGVSHWVQQEAPEKVNALIQKFIQQ